MSNNINNNGGAETTAETLNQNLNTEKDTQKNKTTTPDMNNQETTEKATQQKTAPEQNAQEQTPETDTTDTQETKASKAITILKKWGWKMALGVSIITAAITVVMWINDVASRGDAVRYANACQQYQNDAEPSIWRWASWDREVAAEALLEWSKEFEYYYLNSDDKPTAQEKGMYKRACTFRGLLKAGYELEDAVDAYPNSSQVDTYVRTYGYTSLIR